MTDYSGVVLESQVDWLTVSAHGTLAADEMLAFGLGLAKQQQEKGNQRRPWRMMGFDGTHCGQVEFGQRNSDATQVRLIGDLANEYFDAAMSLADGVTRVDVATTWRADPPDPYLGRNAYALAEMHYTNFPRSAQPSQHGNGDGGYTCYVGKRHSDNFLRIYNKEAECIALNDQDQAERYRSCWRYELEVKGNTARGLSSQLLQEENRAHFIQRYLYTFAERHGIAPAFPYVGAQRLIPGFRRRSDADSRLRHLAKNVKPTIDWLKSEGMLDAARKALGLEEG